MDKCLFKERDRWPQTLQHRPLLLSLKSPLELQLLYTWLSFLYQRLHGIPRCGRVISESLYKHHCSECPCGVPSLPVWVNSYGGLACQSFCAADFVTLSSTEVAATHKCPFPHVLASTALSEPSCPDNLITQKEALVW